MAVQTYNYELSEVRKLLEMNRQQGTRLLEGTYQSLFLTHADDGRWKQMSLIPKTRYLSFTKEQDYCRERAHTNKNNILLEDMIFTVPIKFDSCL